MNISAIIVTRGDQTDGVERIIDELPEEWEKLVWDNGALALYAYPPPNRYWNVDDLGVYGRYAAIEYVSNDLIYVQDDDCIVSDPQAIVNEWRAVERFNLDHHPGMPYADHVVCNMPPEFRHDFYRDHALVGFGAVFHRDAPARAFRRFQGCGSAAMFQRTCDIVFTALTPLALVDVPVEHLPYAHDDNRMWRQPSHVGERAAMLELVRRARKENP